MGDLGKLQVRIEADGTKLNKGLKDAQKQVQAFSRNATKYIKIASAAFVAFGVAATAALTKTFNASIKYGEQLDNMNKLVGISAHSFAKLSFAIEQEHGSTKALIKAFPVLAQRMIDAKNGLESYTREFEALNVRYVDGQREIRNVEDVLIDMADAYEKAGNKTEALGRLTKIMGVRVAKDLIPLFRNGSSHIKELGNQFERLSLLSGDQFNQFAVDAKRFQDKMTDLRFIFQQVGIVITNALLPKIEGFIDELKQADWKKIADSIASVAGAFGEVAKFAGKALVNVGGFIKQFEQGQMLKQAGVTFDPKTGKYNVPGGQVTLADGRTAVSGPGGSLIMGENGDPFAPGNETPIADEKNNPDFKDMGEGVTTFVDDAIVEIERFNEAFFKISDDIAAVWQTTVTGITTSFGTALADSIVDGKDFSDSMKELWKGIAKQVIAQITAMIVKLILLFTWQVATGTVGQGNLFGKVFGFREGGMLSAKNGLALAGNQPLRADKGLAMTGGMGEGGIPAVLHPDEVVAPIDKLFDVIKKMRGDNINVTVNGSGNVNESTLAQMIGVEIQREKRKV